MTAVPSNLAVYLNTLLSPQTAALNVVTFVDMFYFKEFNLVSNWAFQNGVYNGQHFIILPGNQAPVGGFRPIMSFSLKNDAQDESVGLNGDFRASGDFAYKLNITVAANDDQIKIVTESVANIIFSQTPNFVPIATSGNFVDYTYTSYYLYKLNGSKNFTITKDTTPTSFIDNSTQLNLTEFDPSTVENLVGTMNVLATLLKGAVQAYPSLT